MSNKLSATLLERPRAWQLVERTSGIHEGFAGLRKTEVTGNFAVIQFLVFADSCNICLHKILYFSKAVTNLTPPHLAISTPPLSPSNNNNNLSLSHL